MSTKRTILDIRAKGGDKVESDLKKIGAAGEETGKKIKRGGDRASKGLKAVDAAVSRTNTSMRGLADRLGPVGASLRALGPAGLAAAGGTVAAGGLFLLVKRAAESVDALAKQSDAVGLSVETLQEYQFAAGQSGINTELFNNSLIAFTKRMGELESNGGPLLTFLNKYDKSLAGQLVRTTSVEEALDLYLKRIAETESATERAALANAAFSRSGVVMVNLTRDGAEGLAAMRDRAQEFGVITNEAARDAEAMNDRLDELSRTVSVNLDSALLTLAPTIEGITHTLLEGAPAVREYIESFLPLESRSLSSLLATAGKVREDLDKQLNPGSVSILGFELPKVSSHAETGRLIDKLFDLESAIDAVIAKDAELNEQREESKQLILEQREATRERIAAENAAQQAAKDAAAEERKRLATRQKALANIVGLEQKANKAGLQGVALLAAERDEELQRQFERLQQEVITGEEFSRARLAVEKDFHAKRAEIEQKEHAKLENERRKIAEKAAEEFQRPFLNAAENIQRGLGDTFTEIFRNGKADADTFFDGLKDTAARTAGEIAALLVFRPSIVTSGLSGLGLFGSTATAASAASAGVGGSPGGASGLLGLAGLAGAGGMINVPGLGPLSVQSLQTTALAIGAGVAGNYVGNQFSSFIGLNTNSGGTIGGALGGIGGAFIGGPLGAGIGAAIGNTIGNFIGNGFGFGSDKQKFGFTSVAQGGVASPFGGIRVTADKNLDSNALARLISTIDEGIAGILTDAQIKKVSAGIQGTGDFFSVKGFDNEVFDLAKNRLSNIIDAVAGNTVASGLLDDIARSQDNVQQLVARGQEIIGIINAVTGELNAEPLNAAEQALKGINDQFDALASTAASVGLGGEQVEQRRQEAIQQLTDDANESVRLAILAITDPFAASLEGLEADRKQRLAELESLNADIGQANQLFDLRRQQIIDQQLGSFTQANSSISAFLDSLQTSAAGGLSVTQRAANADTQFNDLLGAARTDPGARADLAGFLPGFVDLKRDLFGSTSNFFEFTASLESTLRSLVKPDDTVATLRDVGSAITDGNNVIIEELRDIRSELAELRGLRSNLELLLNAPGR